MLWSSILFLGVAQLCVAKPLNKRWVDHVEKHSWATIPTGWELHGPAPSTYTMDMHIGLKQSNLDGLIESLYTVSDPSHEKYGQHLSKEEVDALVAPHPDTTSIVSSWLGDHDIDIMHTSGAGDYITVRVSVAEAERLLGTKYNVFHHLATGDYVVRTMSYGLPSCLHDHVNVVSPTTYFGTMKSMASTVGWMGSTGAPPVNASCNDTIVPSCLQDLYKTSGYTPKAIHLNKLGITGYLEQYAGYADLNMFYESLNPSTVGHNFSVVLINGGVNDQSNPGLEANLDVQYAGALTDPTPYTFFSTGGSPPFIPDSSTPTNDNEPYLNFLQYILEQWSIPQTISTSYGDDEQSVPYDYAVSVCNLFAQLGARGVSVMFSSGDYGVGSGACTTNDGKNSTIFQPVFPAGCPYVTAVGATTQIPEISTNFSGGGFSRYFPRPPYQDTSVESYLHNLGSTYEGLYNPYGRAYPDVSAQGVHFEIVWNGQTGAVYGTSCSAPTFSSVISLLNDYRLSRGESPLGFLNPFLYGAGAAGLNDITTGPSNVGCGTAGFSPAKGWDPISGLGTPDFTKLQSIVTNPGISFGVGVGLTL